MSHRSVLWMVVAVPVTAALLSCGGSPTATGPAAEQQPIGGARPGGPEPGAASGGARPGGPFDVEAFENRGEDLAGFRTFGTDHCAGGRCVLVEQTSTAADAQEGCEVADFAYDPPAQPAGARPADQFIQRGTTVTVFVHCPPGAGKSGAVSSSSGNSGGPDSSAAPDQASESSAGTGG